MSLSPVLDDHFYQQFKLAGLDKVQITTQDIYPLIDGFKDVPHFKIQQVGQSFLKQPVYRITLGTGPIRVLAWSQMHGDEPTATAALLDLLACFRQFSEQSWQENILSRVTIDIVPMLNPDGADAATRVNAQCIDINRDARALQSPEGRLLHALLTHIKPNVAFNMHDQNRYYSQPLTKQPVVMAFLAPPADKQATETPSRLRAMQIISRCVETLEPLIGGKMARYEDIFSERAFGDFAATQQAACILIESGRDFADPKRQIARKMNVFALLSALNFIASGDECSTQAYRQLPYNLENGYTDLMFKGVRVQMQNGQHYQVDISVHVDENSGNGTIDGIGDLTELKGYTQIDSTHLHFDRGKTFEVRDKMMLDEARYTELLTQGYCRFLGAPELLDNQSSWPIEWQSTIHAVPPFYPTLNMTSWCLYAGDKVAIVVINGQVIYV